MTTLTRIEKMADREIQVWLRDVDSTTLCIALIGASPGVRSRVAKNMSRNAAAAIENEMSSMDAKELLMLKCAQELEALTRTPET